MCIACVKPKNVTIAKSVLKTCFQNNKDGAGFAYPSDDHKSVVIKKGFFSFRSFWKNYREVQALNKPMLIHFRVATSGSLDDKNCHPWKIDDKHAMVHNGVLQNKLDFESIEHSDTGLFVQHILSPIFKNSNTLWKSEVYKWMLEKSIGTNNKIAIIDNKGEIVIYNEKEGEWEGKVWFSNDTYKFSRKSILATNTWYERRNGRVVKVKKRGNVTQIVYINENNLEDGVKIISENEGKEKEKEEVVLIGNEIDPTMLV